MYTKEDLDKLHITLKEILSVIDKLCKKHNILYFATAGTLLGAVRHSDFIPWDDDIDIAMYRDDYDRFLEIAKKELPEEYFCLDFETYKDFPVYCAKICKKGTLFVEKEIRKLKYPHCVFVDIMPFDSLPEDEKKRKKHLRKIRFRNELFKTRILWSVSSISSKKKRIIGNTMRPLLHILLLPFSRRFLYNRLMKCLKKYYSLNKQTIAGYRGVEGFSQPVDVILPLKELKFGDMMIPVPNNYDEALRREFGDYMQLPPLEKRQSHEPYMFKID